MTDLQSVALAIWLRNLKLSYEEYIRNSTFVKGGGKIFMILLLPGKKRSKPFFPVRLSIDNTYFVRFQAVLQ